jgi:hypothetical protein
MLVSYRKTAWHHNPKDLELNLHHHENLKSHIEVCSVSRYNLNITRLARM